MAGNLYDVIAHTDRCFRLLTLLSSTEPAAPLHCTLATHPLDEHPEYGALSYCWGATPRDRRISCNGHPFNVTESLECALRKLRSSEGPRLLWVDAICINQENTSERTHQVKLMQDIYQQAVRVVVWLGLSYENSDLAVRACERLAFEGRKPVLAQACQELSPYMETIHFRANRRDMVAEKVAAIEARGRDVPRDDNQESRLNTETRVKSTELACATDEEIFAIYRLLARPYWGRCWVIQEFCLGTQVLVLCGDAAIGVNDLLFGIFVAILLTPDGKYGKPGDFLVAGGSTPLMTARYEFKKNQSQLDILDLSQKFRQMQATDPRDKVYALLGILSEETRAKLAIEPDYKLTTAECYTRAAAAVLSCRGNLDSLAVVSRDAAHGAMGLPSWVHDWGGCGRKRGRQIPLGSLRPDGESASERPPKLRPFAASRCPGFTVRLKDPNTLALSGLITDKLATVADTLRLPAQGSEPNRTLTLVQSLKLSKDLFYGLGQVFETLVGWEKIALAEETYPTGEDPLRVFAETLGASQMPEGEESMFAGFQSWRRLLRGPKKLAHVRAFGLHKLRGLYVLAMAFAGIKMNGGAEQSWAFVSATDITLGRRLARTEKGFIALVPELSQPGDCVALLRGGKLPLMVRARGSQWEMIGCAYVHGIMFGEAWDESACEDMEVV